MLKSIAQLNIIIIFVYNKFKNKEKMTKFRKEREESRKQVEQSGIRKEYFEILRDVNTKQYFIGVINTDIEVYRRTFNKTRIIKMFKALNLGIKQQ